MICKAVYQGNTYSTVRYRYYSICYGTAIVNLKTKPQKRNNTLWRTIRNMLVKNTSNNLERKGNSAKVNQNKL